MRIYIDFFRRTNITAMWMPDPDGGLDILHLLVDDNKLENECHHSLCGVEYHAKWQSIFDSIDPFEPRLCVSCAARAALLIASEDKE